MPKHYSSAQKVRWRQDSCLNGNFPLSSSVPYGVSSDMETILRLITACPLEACFAFLKQDLVGLRGKSSML